MGTYVRLLAGTQRRLAAPRRDLLLENLALRHQLMMCERRRRLSNADRFLWAAAFRRWSGWRASLLVLHPEERKLEA